MVLRCVDVFMNEEAREVTDGVDVVGNVWSETRLNRRDVITRSNVATFSGASNSARRTVHVSHSVEDGNEPEAYHHCEISK